MGPGPAVAVAMAVALVEAVVGVVAGLLLQPQMPLQSQGPLALLDVGLW